MFHNLRVCADKCVRASFRFRNDLQCDKTSTGNGLTSTRVLLALVDPAIYPLDYWPLPTWVDTFSAYSEHPSPPPVTDSLWLWHKNKENGNKLKKEIQIKTFFQSALLFAFVFVITVCICMYDFIVVVCLTGSMTEHFLAGCVQRRFFTQPLLGQIDHLLGSAMYWFGLLVIDCRLLCLLCQLQGTHTHTAIQTQTTTWKRKMKEEMYIVDIFIDYIAFDCI